MPLIARKSGEALVIGEVVVTCLLISERDVRLVFDLPGGVDVYRRQDLEEGHTLHRRIGRRRQARVQTLDVQCGEHVVLCDHLRSDVHVRSIGEQVVRKNIVKESRSWAFEWERKKQVMLVLRVDVVHGIISATLG